MTSAELLAAGYAITPNAYARLAEFVERLLAANQVHNLTGTRDPAEFWRLHVCDSLALLPLVEAGSERAAAGPRTLIDVGSGGGLPGVPLAIACARLDVTLVDSTRKKMDAVGQIIEGMRLSNVRTIWGRAEQLAVRAELRGQFDIATARAVAAVPKLLGFVAGFVRAGGECWLMKSSAAAAREMAEAGPIARRLRLEAAEPHVYRIPGDTADRVVVRYRKSVGA